MSRDSIDKKMDQIGRQAAQAIEKRDGLETLKNKYDRALLVIKQDDDLKGYVKAFRISQGLIRYAVAVCVASSQRAACDLLGLAYQQAEHRKHRDHKRIAVVIDLVKAALLEEAQAGTSAIDDKMILERLAGIIRDPARSADSVKAIETYTKIKEKIEGDSTLKPWERLWLDTIRPAILASY